MLRFKSYRNKNTLTDRTQHILQEITTYYLVSGDFNGTPLNSLALKYSITIEELINEIKELIISNQIRVIFSDTDVNTHIIRLGFEPKEVQLEKLKNFDIHACCYPSTEHLDKIVNRQDYEGRPYTLNLALGAPQLSYKVFDLSVLEFYRNDPRYEYITNDIHGQISLTNEYYESIEIPESDQIFLETFGYCYDDDLNRAVAVFNRYISDLSPEHQQIWNAKEIHGNYKLHPDYYLNTIVGDWGERIPIFDAFLMELQVINKMTIAMGRSPLFREDFSSQSKPREFSFLVRPTLKEYHDFVLLLDKLLSENIKKEFFQDEVDFEYDEIRQDGKIVVRQKNTINVLDEWFRSRFRTSDWEPFNKTIRTFREIRRLRQRPAHAIDDNVFDQKFIHKQRELMISAYDSLRTIRLMLANHPLCKDIEVDDLLFQGKIWSN